MNKDDVLNELLKCSDLNTRKIYINHGADLEVYGAKIADIKRIAKKIKLNHELALELFSSDVGEAQYMTKYIIDPNRVNKDLLNMWLTRTSWYMIVENTIPDIATMSSVGFELLDEWMNSKNDRKLQAAYSLYSSLLSIKDNSLFDIVKVKNDMDYVVDNIQNSANRVRYTMNNFIIACGAYIPELTEYAKECAKKIGKVNVSMGNTSCKVPDAFNYIKKIEDKKRIGLKRKSVC